MFDLVLEPSGLPLGIAPSFLLRARDGIVNITFFINIINKLTNANRFHGGQVPGQAKGLKAPCLGHRAGRHHCLKPGVTTGIKRWPRRR